MSFFKRLGSALRESVTQEKASAKTKKRKEREAKLLAEARKMRRAHTAKGLLKIHTRARQNRAHTAVSQHAHKKYRDALKH